MLKRGASGVVLARTSILDGKADGKHCLERLGASEQKEGKASRTRADVLARLITARVVLNLTLLDLMPMFNLARADHIPNQ